MTNFSAIDHQHMALALRLAEQGRFTTRPNPRVGCVLAHGAELVGTGFHERAGQPHAEVFALRMAGAKARGATAYVTLEPCAHYGRTPPCADALIAAGVARVVIASGDPFAKVAGRGIEKLRAAGIAVEQGLLHEAARALNRGFFSRIERQRPWLTLKMAMSMDGKIALANGQSQWLTGSAARADVQKLRAESCAIVTGIGTVLADNPALTLRDARFQLASEPLKVVLDRAQRIPLSVQLFGQAANLLIAHCGGARADLQSSGAQLLQLPELAQDQIPFLLSALAERQINDVLIEAGATLAGAFLQAAVVDEIVLYQAPMLLGDDARSAFAGISLASLSSAFRFKLADARAVGADLRLTLRPI